MNDFLKPIRTSAFIQFTPFDILAYGVYHAFVLRVHIGHVSTKCGQKVLLAPRVVFEESKNQKNA